jgi:hypothetical protein
MRGMETLEGRRLFSFVATAGSGGSLDITVDGAVTVQEVTSTTFVVSDPTGGQDPQTFTGVEILTITGGNGDDEIRLSAFGSNLSVIIDAGGGDDRVFVTDDFNVLPFSSRPAGFVVAGGNGSDYIEITRGSNTTAFGDNGDDVIVVLSGSANEVYGGNGDDTAYVVGGTTVALDGGRGSDNF